MSKFPMIISLGLHLWRFEKGYFIDAEKLESLLQSAQVVYGISNGHGVEFSKDITLRDTHQDLLLCVEPIKKKTRAEAALEFVEKFKSGMLSHVGYLEAEKEAKRILEMKDEV